jgi:ABC-2 type transport system permease protein
MTMGNRRRAFIGGMDAELRRLRRSRLLLALVLVQAMTFLVLVTLFGMTGAFAPTIVVNHDNGPISQQFIANLENDHHSFTITMMSNETAARDLVTHGTYVALIVIPAGFSQGIADGKTVPITVFIDNINTDMSDDIERAVPSAVLAFGNALQFQGLSAGVVETDVYPTDTSFINYMIASAFVLDTLIIAGTLSALSVADEFEAKTAKFLAVSPVHPLIPLTGRVATTILVSLGALLSTVYFALLAYGIAPVDPASMLLVLVFCVVIFSLIGAALGSLIKRALPVAMLVLGVALPLYLFSGSYEPQRFDGNMIWMASHASPEYYAVGLMEHAVFGLQVTPEPLLVLAATLTAFGVGALGLAGYNSRRGFR